MKNSRLWFLVVAASLLGPAVPVLAGDVPQLGFEKTIPLEGGSSFDLMVADTEGGRLYVAHSPGVDVVDVAKAERVGTMGGVDRAHGVALVPGTKRGFAAAGKANRLVVFDTGTLKAVKEVETGEGPDAVLYVSATKEVWVFNGRGKSATCVAVETLEVVATVPLDGKPELAAEDAGKGLVYVNFEDKSAVCVIDAKKHAVVATHSVAPGEGPTGIALDEKNGRLFAGCGNGKLVVLDTGDWSAVATLSIGEHCDGVVFDPGTGNAFASCRDLTAVVHEKDPRTFEAFAPLVTPGGKTCALDAKSHRLFVGTGPRRGEAGTVAVLVFAPGATGTPPAPPAASTVSSWTGHLEKAGPSIAMEGTHRLTMAGGKAVLLLSKTVDLSKYEGKTVTVTGHARPTVEGGMTIVDVEEAKEAP